MWDMVKRMVDVPVKVTGDILKLRGSALMQRAFMNQARRYLEDRYTQSFLCNSLLILLFFNLGTRPSYARQFTATWKQPNLVVSLELSHWYGASFQYARSPKLLA